ncbi:type IV toxin-antitoxin system AbiEi family antitoxin domain-containing protein [Gordonia phthalatica]|uniref:type IV toxin-antitoxin system AbiEi family antitoxin domain-containing protein n=1 Tax=Gordonia phthalatica TaxID=1136941 RepID=UPI000A6588A1
MGDIDIALALLAQLIKDQSGVITRQQVFECGLDSAFVRQRLRSGLWVPVYPGVYLTHTGEPTWLQRAWCAVLDAAPAVLSHSSALRAAERRDCSGHDDEAIHITVAAGRRVSRRPGVVVHHRALSPGLIHDNMRPPRIRLEEALLDIARTICAPSPASRTRFRRG